MTLKIGVVSFAHLHSTSYISTFTGLEGIELLTCDPDAALADATDVGVRGAAFAAQFGAPYVESFEELLAWGPDAVMVCSENALHYQYAIAALHAGAHVLSEKPLTTSAAHARELAEVAAANDRLLMVAFPVRFGQEIGALREFIRTGHLGEVQSILGTNNGMLPYDTRHWFTNPELSGGGAIVDHTVHCADLIDFILDAQPESVYAVCNSILHGEKNLPVETAGLVNVRYDSGVIATIDCSWSQPDAAATWGGVTLTVSGSRGTVGIDAFGERVEGSGVHGTHGPGAMWLSYGENTDALMISRFIAAVQGWADAGARAELLEGLPLARSGVRTVSIVDAALESAHTGVPVAVPALQAGV